MAARSLLTEALAQAPADIEAAMETPFEEIGWFNPWLDIAAARTKRPTVGCLFLRKC